MAPAHELVMAEGGGVVPDHGRVPTRRPRLALASPHHGTDLGTALQFGQDVEQTGVHIVVEGVALVRIVVGDHRNRTAHL